MSTATPDDSDPESIGDTERKSRDSRRTRAELLRAARVHFADKGYAGAHTKTIVAMSGKTRGALYHHFLNKAGLFRAVLEEIQREITEDVVTAAANAKAPMEGIRAGFQAYLDACLRQDVSQIVLLDGPAVLGWATWHEIDQRHAFGLTRGAIAEAMEAKALVAAPIDAMTRVLLGAVTQASLEIGRASDRVAARREIGEVVDLILVRLADQTRDPAA